jgi:hypothetical protein
MDSKVKITSGALPLGVVAVPNKMTVSPLSTFLTRATPLGGRIAGRAAGTGATVAIVSQLLLDDKAIRCDVSIIILWTARILDSGERRIGLEGKMNQKLTVLSFFSPIILKDTIYQIPVGPERTCYSTLSWLLSRHLKVVLMKVCRIQLE